MEYLKEKIPNTRALYIITILFATYTIKIDENEFK